MKGYWYPLPIVLFRTFTFTYPPLSIKNVYHKFRLAIIKEGFWVAFVVPLYKSLFTVLL